jgi:hypothetical protein
MTRPPPLGICHYGNCVQEQVRFPSELEELTHVKQARRCGHLVPSRTEVYCTVSRSAKGTILLQPGDDDHRRVGKRGFFAWSAAGAAPVPAGSTMDDDQVNGGKGLRPPGASARAF